MEANIAASASAGVRCRPYEDERGGQVGQCRVRSGSAALPLLPLLHIDHRSRCPSILSRSCWHGCVLAGGELMRRRRQRRTVGRRGGVDGACCRAVQHVRSSSNASRARTRLFVGQQLCALSFAPLGLLHVTRSRSNAGFSRSLDSSWTDTKLELVPQPLVLCFRLTSSSSTPPFPRFTAPQPFPSLSG
jgi:hypothetical protein